MGHDPLGPNDPSPYQIPCISNVYLQFITVAKLQLGSCIKNNFTVGVPRHEEQYETVSASGRLTVGVPHHEEQHEGVSASGRFTVGVPGHEEQHEGVSASGRMRTNALESPHLYLMTKFFLKKCLISYKFYPA